MKAVMHNKIVEKCAAPASEKLLKKEELNREIEWESKAGYVTLGSMFWEWSPASASPLTLSKTLRHLNEGLLLSFIESLKWDMDGISDFLPTNFIYFSHNKQLWLLLWNIKKSNAIQFQHNKVIINNQLQTYKPCIIYFR